MNFNGLYRLPGWKQAFAKRCFARVVTPAMYHCWLALLAGKGKIDGCKSLIFKKSKNRMVCFSCMEKGRRPFSTTCQGIIQIRIIYAVTLFEVVIFQAGYKKKPRKNQGCRRETGKNATLTRE
ncbi:MAG: hypothetical protein KTR20_14950 [Cellvibrionaceae bacterium]|nr:hypothetical protein [Cellvibrionaceae bacterium]